MLPFSVTLVFIGSLALFVLVQFICSKLLVDFLAQLVQDTKKLQMLFLHKRLRFKGFI